MKTGDVILNIDNRIIVTYKGYIMGRISSYRISDNEGSYELFTGTKEELLRHCADKIEAINERTKKLGGTLI